MGRRQLLEEDIRNIQKSKGSYYITIPIQIMRDFKWQERQKVVVKKGKKGEIVITDWEA